MGDAMQGERRNVITDVLAYLFLAFVLICAFFDVGFFLALNPNVGAGTLMGNLETLVSLPIVPMTTWAVLAFNYWSLEAYATILVLLVLYLVAQPFRRIARAGLALVPRVSMSPVLQLYLSWLLLLLAFVVLLWWISFPDISPEANAGTVLTLGATLLVGVLVVNVSFVRTRDVILPAIIATTAIWVFMFLPLRWGLIEGAWLRLRLPSDKAELTGGAAAIGRAVVAVPAGIVFVEYKGPGQRETSVLGGEQIVRIGALSKAELEPILAANQLRVPPVKATNLLCEFVESWTRKLVKLCDTAENVNAKSVAALTVSPDGQIVWLSADDPRVAQAVSLEAIQADLAAHAKEENKAPPLIP